MTGRVQTWVGGSVAVVAVGALVVHLAVVGLDQADKWASVLGLFVALAGLGVSVAGIRRGAGGGTGPSQTVESSAVGGGVTQVAGTGGSVRITHRGPAPVPPPAVPPGAAPAPAQPSGGDQSVRGTSASGPVNQVRDTASDVEIDGP
ncbi:hypothetical protein [Streptomyces sp. SID3212]|uniref:hypothetical protein n=1 Tax=Streptomyces sp. SID3212 TaxID=2690259 RepID=UPI00136F39A2|nr:hypothetical protein [Streptomyces sp. SID3212]MYV53170.1 hypothetical protein [Streptomyces sp. SID3212]